MISSVLLDSVSYLPGKGSSEIFPPRQFTPLVNAESKNVMNKDDKFFTVMLASCDIMGLVAMEVYIL